MNIIFVGGFFPKYYSDEIFEKSIHQIQNSANNFQWAFIRGLQNNIPSSVRLITAPFVGWFPKYYKQIFISTQIFTDEITNSNGVLVGFCNIPLIKNIFKYFGLLGHIKSRISSCEDNVIIVYSLDSAYLKAALDAKKSNLNLRVCVIIPDLHDFSGDSGFLYKMYIKYIEKKIFYNQLHRIDAYVVLTDKMVDYLGIAHKPWVRIEGLYESGSEDILPPIDINAYAAVRVILYTGTLDMKYGIAELLSAFSQIEDKNFRLWVCGGGLAAPLVKERALHDPRITYFGIVNKQKVKELQAKATVLINPRNNEGDYNKYSFPSKTMEYLASGTPTLMYRLDGVPSEYFDYCYTVNDNSVRGLANAITCVCNKDLLELKRVGQQAKNFILSNKSADKQCSKVIKMLRTLFNPV